MSDLLLTVSVSRSSTLSNEWMLKLLVVRVLVAAAVLVTVAGVLLALRASTPVAIPVMALATTAAYRIGRRRSH
jgi:hypothetical protein